MNDYDALIKSAASKHLSVWDWRYLKAQYWEESKFDPDAVSPAGAVGIAQFMPRTWTDVANKAGFKGAKRTDPEASIYCGAYYMNQMLSGWTAKRPDIDKYCLALASYNAGFGNLLKAQKVVGGKNLYCEIIVGLVAVTGDDDAPETINYVKRILQYYSSLITTGKL